MTCILARRSVTATVALACASALAIPLAACGESTDGREEPQVHGPPALPGSQVVAECGDGWTDADEACDDGNVSDGDYCAADCRAVTGSCGDGVWQDNEQCEGPLGYFGMCTADCLPQPGVACSREGEPSCQTLQLSGLPHESMMSQLTAPDMTRFCGWFNSVKSAISAELGQSVLRCSGFNFDYKPDDCSNVTTRGSDTLAAYGLTCDMSVLQFERCFWDAMVYPCKTVRLEQGRVRMASACWSEACASQPQQDAGL